MSLTVDGKLRDYRLFRPPGLDYTKPIPLVIVLHGSPQDAAGLESIIHFDNEATTAGFLTAFPNGCGGFWSYAEGGPKSVDEQFISKMIDQLESQFRIDKTRVFAVAVSAGTWVAYRLACDQANRIAAIASVSGTQGWFSFVDQSHGFALSPGGGSAVALYMTSDGGVDWTPLNLPELK